MNTKKDFRTCKILTEEKIKWQWLFLKLIQSEFYASHKVLELNEENKAKIALCFDWVVGGVDVSLNKGLLLRGDVGTGKSAILKACRTFCEILYDKLYSKYIMADEISRLYGDKTEESERKLNNIMTCKLLFIDDIGYEALKVFDHYPIAEVVRERYDKKRITCFTTNMTMDEMRLRYQKSFEDKVSEMCFIIAFNGVSKRGE